jgi:hypothetical protein
MASLGTVIRRILGECSTPAGPAGTLADDDDCDTMVDVAVEDEDEDVEDVEDGMEGGAKE